MDAEQHSVPSRKKILIHGMNFAPEPIGVGRYTDELAAYLAGQGESIEVVTSLPHYPGWTIRPPYRPRRYVLENRSGIQVIRCPLVLHPSGRGIWRLIAPLSFAIAAAPVVIWRIFRSHPHVVVCVEPTLFSTPAAVLAAKVIGARCILHVQDLEVDAAFDVGHLKGNWLRNLASVFERFFLRRFDLIITISERMKQKLISKRVPSSSVTVLRNWVDTSKIRCLNGPNSFRDQLGIATTDFVVLYSGQIGPKQALHLLLEAALKCNTESGIQFVVAGDGPTKKSLFESYSYVPYIHFLPLQPEEKLCELLNLADLHVIIQDRSASDLVLPSKLGGMLASGRSVLVTADLGTELYDLLFGIAILVPPGDVQALAEAIRSASRQRSNPPAEATKLLEQFSSRTILPAFHQAICGN
jgi:colanic acid biosynthesis glycosyl transferase WcaI